MRHGRLWFTSFFALLSSCLIWLGAQAPPTKPAPKAEAKEELTAEERNEANIIERFKQVLEANPRRGTALDRIYGYHVERGSLQKLIDEYGSRAKKNEADGVACMVVGLLEAQRGKDANAAAAFKQAEKHLSANAMPGYYLGQSLILIGQPDAAAEAFERAIARKPGRTDLLDIFQALGRVYQRAQKADKALDVWNRVEKLFPDDPRVQDQIATTLIEEGQFDQALPRLEKLAAKTEDPYRKATLLMEAAELKVKLKQSPKALADLEKMLGELNPDSWLYRDVRRRIEDVFVRNDDLAGLSKYYEAWIGKNPNDVEAIARLARNLSTQGRLPEARTWLERGIAVAPTRKELRQALIDQLSFEQKYAEAIPHYEAMDKADPNNPDILREWGKLVMRDAGKPEAERQAAAVAIWKRLLEKKAKDPVVTSQVADLIRSAGMAEEAIELYKKAIELAPNSAQYREYLGEYFHSLKRSEEALATWRPIAEGTNRNAKNLARLAEVFGGFGYRKEAVAALADAVALDKTDFNLYVAYADQLHQNEQHEEALKQLDNAAKLISNAEDAESILLALIKIYQATDSLPARIDELQKELDDKKDPTADRWHRLARYFDANRQTAEATAAINKAVELDAKSIPILTSAARIYEASGNLLVAAETNRKLANLDRRFRTEYLTNVAKLESKLGRREQALQAGRDLLAAAPGNPDNYKFFAELCFQLGDPEEGLESLRRSVRANPSEPQGLLTLAQALNDRQRSGEAIELLWRAFEKTNELDGRLGIISQLTEQYLQMNQFDRLLERLERERREADKAREMTLCIAAAYQAAGDLGTSRAQLEHLLSENTRDVALLSQLSQLAESEGDFNSALKYQRQVEKAAPNNPESQLRLAQLLVRVGESSEAAEIWVKLAAGEPDPHRNLQAIDQLALAGKSDAVLAITSRLLAQKPTDWELLYREGAGLAQLNKHAEAAKRFQKILDLKLADDEMGAALKSKQKSKIKDTAKGMAAANAGMRGRFDPVEVPLLVRIQNLYQLLGITGSDPRYSYYAVRQGGSWSPRDYGQARLAAIAWLHAFAQNDNKKDEFIERMKKAKIQAGSDNRARWDWYYLQNLRMDYKEIFEASTELAKLNDPAGHLAFLNATGMRAIEQRRYNRSGNPDSDRTPPLPNDQLEQVLASYRKLRQAKPDWLTNQIAQNVLTELKRAKRAEENELYRDAVASAKTLGQVQEALQLASTRGDIPAVTALFEKLEKLQGPPKASINPGQMPTRRAADFLAVTMNERSKANAFDDVTRVLDVYLAHVRRQNTVLLRSPSSKPAVRRGNNVIYGPNGQMVVDFPPPNDYFDDGSINLLRTAYEAFKAADLLSDLFAHFQKSLAAADAAEKVYHHLALGYMHWWSAEKDEALEQLLAGARQVPNDLGLLLDVADLREKNNDLHEALALLDSIEPLDHTIMQRREEAALRIAERTGNVARARQAAERLFGLRLDAEKQVDLAGKMHRLGMHEMAETVLGRAGRQAGSRNQALLSLMNQYQSQGQGDMAIQIARQLLRKSPTVNIDPYNRGNPDDNVRRQAIQVIARSGKLKEMIERAEAQLKSSPKSMQAHQALLDYHRAAGDTKKVKEIILKMAELKPDDGKVRFAMAQQLQQINERVAAVEQYKIAIKLEPTYLMNRYWEIIQLFQQQGKQEELAKIFDEIDFRKIRAYYVVLQIVQPMLQDEKTREHGLQLFRKAWAAFPEERSQMMSYINDGDVSILPEIYSYACEAVLPRGDTAAQPWRGAEEITYYNNGPTGPINKLLELARQQNRIEPLRKEVAELVKQKPQWQAGKAMLAIIDLQLGKADAARKAWTELLDDKTNPMPGVVRGILSRELENYSSFEDLYIRTVTGGVDELLDDPNSGFGDEGPLYRLARVYYKSGRKDEARSLIFKCLKSTNPYDAGYGAYLKVQSSMGAVQFFLTEEEPVEAVRVCNNLLYESDALSMAARYYGENMKQSVEALRRQSIKSMKTGNLSESLRTLIEPRPLSASKKEMLDLVLLVDSRDLAKAKLTSMLAEAIEAAAKKPELLADAVAQLDQLAVKHPGDFSVQIAAAVAALAQNKPERIDAALARVCKLMDEVPLEPLAGKTKANARQRAEAVKQIGLWFVANQCLKSDKLRPTGEKLAARAVASAKRMLDPLQAQVMLREWGQLDSDRGDTKAAEARWAELLESVLPPPPKQKPAASGASAPPPAATGASSSAPAQEREGDADEQAAAATVFVSQVAPPLIAPAPTAPLSGGAAVITHEQFDRAMQIAKIAAERKLLDFSLKAVKDALRGGPAVSVPNEDMMRPRRMVMTASGQMVVDGDYVGASPEGRLNELIALWRKNNVPLAQIYQVLLVAVLPDSRPAEIFLNRGANMGGPSNKSVGDALVGVAIEAGQVEDLRKRVRSRLGQPLGEMNARILMLELALRTKNNPEALQVIKELGDRLQRDTLQTTANLIAGALRQALTQPELSPAVEPVLERAVKNLAGNNHRQAQDLLFQLAQHYFDRKDEAAARRAYAEIQEIGKRASVREGDQFRMEQTQRLAGCYVRHGWLPEALEQLGRYVDGQLTLTEDHAIRNEIKLNEMPLLALALAREPAARRYELLRNWTFPTSAKALRFATGALPTEVPPAAFGSFPIPAGSLVSTGTMLCAAAKEVGKLDELTAELDKLADQKIENAVTLRLLAHLFRNEQAAQEPALRERLKEVRERADFKAPNNGPYMRYAPGDDDGPQRPAIRNADILIAQIAAADAKTEAVAEEMLKTLLKQSQVTHADQISAFIHPELRKIEARRQQLPDYRPASALAKWSSLSPRTLWIAQDGLVHHLPGKENAFLLFDYPLAGTFEFSVDASQGAWAEGHAGFGGIVFEPNRPGVNGSLWCVGGYDRINRQPSKIRNEAFNRLTFQVAPGKVRFLLNGELVYEDTDPAPTSPWMMLWSRSERASSFRNFTLTGKPEIPKEVRLTHGNYLEGWTSNHYPGQLPARMQKKEPKQPNPNMQQFRGGIVDGDEEETTEPVYVWEAKDGEILGRKLDTPPVDPAPSLLSYFRPLKPGEKIHYEFFHQPGEFDVHPCLGRLAFLLAPDGVKLRLADRKWT